MPIYEYVCLKCNERFSLLQSVTAGEHNTQCPKCSAKNVRKVISAFSCSCSSGAGPSSAPSGGFSGGG